jgi:hypothetical protein
MRDGRHPDRDHSRGWHSGADTLIDGVDVGGDDVERQIG